MSRSLSLSVLAVAILPVIAISACASNRKLAIGADCDDGFCDGEGLLTPTPVDAGDAEQAAAPMCPVTTCSLPWTTCPSSEFPCGTNLQTDDDNCGACGVRCAGEDSDTNSKWTCVKGQCTFSCIDFFRDCDDDVTNGCESFVPNDKENCGSCGNKCDGDRCIDSVCEPCPARCNGRCVNLRDNPLHCGTCGNTCDFADPSLPPLPADMFYGCENGTCGHPICYDKGLNCNGDLSDGCEGTLGTNEHCGGCYDACPIGKPCMLVTEAAYHCGCLDDDATVCGTACARLADDPENCGGCFNRCPGLLRPHFEATCSLAVCGGKCEANYADCDGISENGCEVNTFVDNRNCGACGNACLPNQVCSQGTCLVTPCDAGTPGDPTK
jgi:hypothetical protein